MKRKMESKALQDERDQKLALAALADQDGGKQIIEALRSDVVRYVEQLAGDYRTASHFDLVRVCADLSATLSLYRALTRAEGNVKEIDQMLEEALHE